MQTREILDCFMSTLMGDSGQSSEAHNADKNANKSQAQNVSVENKDSLGNFAYKDEHGSWGQGWNVIECCIRCRMSPKRFRCSEVGLLEGDWIVGMVYSSVV